MNISIYNHGLPLAIWPAPPGTLLLPSIGFSRGAACHRLVTEWTPVRPQRGKVTRTAMIEAIHLDIRGRLAAFARSRGLSADDAEDLAGDAWLKVSAWAERTCPTEAELFAYSYRAIKNLIVDWYSSPGRVVTKRLAHVLAQRKGDDPIVAWLSAGEEVVGLESQRAKNAEPARPEWIDSNLSEFLYSAKGLGGDAPGGLSTRFLVTRLVTWCGGPIPKRALVDCLTSVSSVPLKPKQLPDDLPGPTTPEASNLGDRMWNLITGLPYRMRAALLLSLDEELTIMLGGGQEPNLPRVLNEWTPPPELIVAELPFPDEVVASALGVAKGNLHVIRSRAREIVRRRLCEEGQWPAEASV